MGDRCSVLPINFHAHILNFQLLIRQLGMYSSPIYIIYPELIMKYMKKIFIVLLFTQCVSMNNQHINLTDGLYYGQNKGFIPQTSVFVNIKGPIALAEGFYPLKGMLFATFTDTLYYSEEKNSFDNEKSAIYFKNNELYFERKDTLLAFQVKKTKLINDRDNEGKYASFKERAVSYYSFWK
jgi:hypothetical protein